MSNEQATNIIYAFLVIGLASPIFLLLMNLLSKGATPGRTLKKQIPPFRPPKHDGRFTLVIGREKESNKLFPLKLDTLVGHILLLAPTRKGKSTFLQSLTEQFLEGGLNFVQFDGQKSETEPTLKLAKKHHRETAVLPAQYGFNPLNNGASPTKRAIAFAEVLAEVSGFGGGDSEYWLQFSQLYLQHVIPLHERAFNNQPMILDELIDLLTLDSARKKLMAAARPTWDETYNFNIHFGNWTQAQYDKTLANLILFLRRIADADIKNMYNVRNAPTIKEHIEAGRVVIIQEGGTKGEVYARARGLCYIVALQKYIATREQKQEPELGVLLDEAHLYFNSSFDAYMATCAKYNVINILAFQALSQLEDILQTVITNCITWFALNGTYFEDAKIFAEQTGRVLYKMSNVNHAGDKDSITESLQYDYLYQPGDIQKVPANEMYVITAYDRQKEPARIVKRPEMLDLSKIEVDKTFPEIKPDISVYRQLQP